MRLFKAGVKQDHKVKFCREYNLVRGPNLAWMQSELEINLRGPLVLSFHTRPHARTPPPPAPDPPADPLRDIQALLS